MVLIVDDNMNFVNRMVGLLEDMDNIGYISIASDYNEAYKVLLERNPDFVLLDINLPGKNGIELLQTIKRNGWNCEVIMITNHADDYYRGQCMESGAAYFLDKSNEFALVPELISQMVSAKS